MAGLFDADIVADATALSTSQLVTITRDLVAMEPRVPQGADTFDLWTKHIWEFMELAQRAFRTVIERCPEATTRAEVPRSPPILAPSSSSRVVR
jgi:hypothetical protein